MEGCSHKFGLGGANDFSLEWVPHHGRSDGKDDAQKQSVERWLRFRLVEVTSMVAFVGVCSMSSGFALAVVALYFLLLY